MYGKVGMCGGPAPVRAYYRDGVGLPRRVRCSVLTEQDASIHAQLWFADRDDRALRLVRAVPEGRDVQLDDLHLVGELLQGALSAF